MSHVALLNIGNTTFSIHSSIPADQFFFDEDIHYVNFERQLTEPSNAPDPDIEICINPGMAPSTAHYRLLFSVENSWSIYANGTGYALTLQPPSADRPIWTAVTDASIAKVSLHLNEHLPPYYPLRYPLDQAILLHHLAFRQGSIIHAAGMMYNHKAYIFPGISGAGKSTVTNLLRSRGAFSFLSDDRIIVRQQTGIYRGYGTPWPGESGIAENRNAPLAGIYFLCKSPANRLVALTPREAFERLMPVASIPWYHPFLISQLFDFFQDLVKEVPAHDLHFFPSSDLGDFLARSLA